MTGSPWQITITGQDHGVIFLTFSNDFTSVGYGISLDALGPFAVTGTWGTNAKQDLTGGFTEFFAAGSQAGLFVGKLTGNGSFVAKVRTTHGPEQFKSPSAGPVPDLSGSWAGSVVSSGKKALESFTLTPSTNNMPGWFDLTGTGINDTGSFALSGAVLVTTDRHAAGYTISNFGTDTLQAAFVGRITRKANKLMLHGRDENNQGVTLHAEKPKPK